MAIELSNLTFTNQADVVPAFGVDEIVNTGVANTLAGNDTITSIGTEYNLIGEPTGDGMGFYNIGTGFYNIGTLNTADGNDIITGIHSPIDPYNSIGLDIKSYGILHKAGTIDTGNGNDIITGISEARIYDFSDNNNFGIYIGSNSTIDTGKGNDLITGRGLDFGILNYGTIHTDDGNDLITGTAGDGLSSSLHNLGVITTGDGNDRITGTGTGTARSDVGLFTTDTIDTGNGNDIITGIGARVGIENYGTINTGNGNDSIIAEVGFDPLLFGYNSIFNRGDINSGNGNDSIIFQGKFSNYGNVFLGEGNDSLIANADLPNPSINNVNVIETGDGNDIIISNGVIYNYGTINTGDGKDSIIADGGFDGSGNVFLGEGEDHLMGFGSGSFNGSQGVDTLQLTSGSYTVGRSATAVNFIKNSITMNTSEFEILIAGNTIYNFATLTNGQTITIA
jgi:hypothetical protein